MLTQYLESRKNIGSRRTDETDRDFRDLQAKVNRLEITVWDLDALAGDVGGGREGRHQDDVEDDVDHHLVGAGDLG